MHRMVPITRRQAAYEIARHAVDFIGAYLRETLVNGLGPKACGRIPELMPVTLKTFRERHRAALPSVSGAVA